MGVFQCPCQRFGIVIGDHDKSRGIRSEIAVSVRIGADRDNRGRPAVKIIGAYDDPGLVFRDALYLVTPAPAKLDGRLYGFDARIHRQYLVIAEIAGDILYIFPEHVAIKGPGSQGQLTGLLYQRGNDARMAMPLVHCRISTETVKIATPIHIPDIDPRPAIEDDRQRVVVMGAMTFFQFKISTGQVRQRRRDSCCRHKEGDKYEKRVYKSP